MTMRAELLDELVDLRETLDAYAVTETSGRETALVRTKLEEAELWLSRVRMRDGS